MEQHQHPLPSAAKGSPELTERLHEIFSQSGFMPHGHCYLWKPLLVSLHVISDTLIGSAYILISFTLCALIKRVRVPFNQVVIFFAVFIGACGLTHLMEVWNLWHADYWWAAWIKIVTAIASVGTGIYLWQLRHSIVLVAQAAKLANERRLDLEVLTKKLEVTVRERTHELEAAVRARDQFLSIASHELKTPLTTLKLVSQMQGRKLDRDHPMSQDDFRKFTQKVNKQIERLTLLVDDMLDTSRIQEGHLKLQLNPQDLAKLVRELAERFTPQILEQGGELNLNRCESIIVLLDTYRIEQLIGNLLMNAIKYAPGTRITLELFRWPGDKVRLAIHDEGPGIPLEAHHRIFERFGRAATGNEASGLGLGLFISREIVTFHGGKIWVEDGPGKGANFIIELPLINGPVVF